MDNRQHIFELKKENILNNFKNKEKYDSALVFALQSDCYPIFHEEFKEFEDMFKIKSDIQNPFYKYIDKFYVEQEYKTFYQILQEFKDTQGKKLHKYNIITMLRYAILTNKFSGDDFKNALLTQGQYPIEAVAIFKPFTKEDI